MGILPAFYSSMISAICGSCKSYSRTSVYFDRTKSGRKSKRDSESDLKNVVCSSYRSYYGEKMIYLLNFMRH